MRIHLGSDHAGYEIKNAIAESLRSAGHDVVDHGPFEYDALDDYPVFCLRAALAVASEFDASATQEAGCLGVVLGGSGNGEQIAANKVAGVRAVLAYDLNTAALGRQHNNANVLSVGARMHPIEDVLDMVNSFLSTPFSEDVRHERRIQMLRDFEADGTLPALPRGSVD